MITSSMYSNNNHSLILEHDIESDCPTSLDENYVLFGNKEISTDNPQYELPITVYNTACSTMNNILYRIKLRPLRSFNLN